MEQESYITVEVFCQHHGLNMGFIDDLNALDLIQIVAIEERPSIPITQLAQTERLIRLHQDLEINPEALPVVLDLLEKIDRMEREMESLRAQLRWHAR